jgi:WD40 repeat protein
VFIFRPGRVTVRDLSTGKERGWDVPNVQECRLALSPDGRLLAGIAADGSGGRTLRTWEAATGKEIHTVLLGLSRLGRTRAALSLRDYLSFSLNGSRLLVMIFANEGPDQPMDVSIWDPISGNRFPAPVGLTGTMLEGHVPSLSPDGKWLLQASGNALKTWEAATGKPGIAFPGHTESIQFCGFAPDGKTCWSITPGGRLREWAFRSAGPTGLPLGLGKYAAPFHSAISGDGLRFAACAPPPVQKPDANTERFPLPSLWSDRAQVCDATGKPLRLLTPPGPGPLGIYGLGLDREGRRAFLIGFVPKDRTMPAQDRTSVLTLWDVERGTVLRQESFKYRPEVRMAPDGGRVAVLSGDGASGTDGPCAIRLFDAEGRTEPKLLPLPDSIPPTATVLGLATAFSPDGRNLAARITTNAPPNPVDQLVVWDLDRGGPPASFGLAAPEGKAQSRGAQYDLFWSPDGAWLIDCASRYRSGPAGQTATVSISILDPSTGATLATLEQPLPVVGQRGVGIAALAVSPDSRRLAALLVTGLTGDKQGEVRVWETQSGKLVLADPLEILENMQRNALGFGVATLSFSTDGRSLTLRELGLTTVTHRERRLASPGGR